MKILMPILLGIFFVLFFIFPPSYAYAQEGGCGPTEKKTELGCIPTDPIAFVQKFYGIGLGLIGGVGLIFIIYGGYIIVGSEGNPAALNRGKSYIMYAMMGIALAVFGFVFIQVIAVDILHIPGFG